MWVLAQLDLQIHIDSSSVSPFPKHSLFQGLKVESGISLWSPRKSYRFSFLKGVQTEDVLDSYLASCYYQGSQGPSSVGAVCVCEILSPFTIQHGCYIGERKVRVVEAAFQGPWDSHMCLFGACFMAFIWLAVHLLHLDSSEYFTTHRASVCFDLLTPAVLVLLCFRVT